MTIAKRLAIPACLVGALVVGWVLTHAQDQKSPPIVTFDDLMKAVKDGVKDREILQRLKGSPTTFVLDDKQIDRLRKAGASADLLEDVQKKIHGVAGTSDVGAFVIILDCSGSMIQPDEAKWKAAKEGAMDLVNNIPLGREVAFIAYGTQQFDDKDKAKQQKMSCQDVKVLRPLSVLNAKDKANLKQEIDGLKPWGMTPMALSLRTAADELAKTKQLAKVILITDGKESCEGPDNDPAKAPSDAAADLVKKFKHLEAAVEVVGYALKDDEREGVAKIADAGRGQFHDAKTADDLAKKFKALKDQVNEKPNPWGKPKDMQKGQLRRWYVWYDEQGWHVRTTTKSRKHTFEGTVLVDDGMIRRVTPFGLENQKDSWNLLDDNQRLRMHFTTDGLMDGFDFEAGMKVKELTFTLRIDEERTPGWIYIGEKAVNPGRATFTLPAHPPKPK